MNLRIVLASFALVAALGFGSAAAVGGGATGGGGGLSGSTFTGALTGNLDVSGTGAFGTADALTIATDGDLVTSGSIQGAGITSTGGVAGTTGAFSDAVGFANGTAAAPSIGWTSDADGTGTGFYRPAADQINVATGGSARVRFAGTTSFFTGVTFEDSTTLGNAATDTTAILGPISNSGAGTGTGCSVAGAVCVADTLNVTGAATLSNGSAAAPAVNFGDANTGLYRVNGGIGGVTGGGTQVAQWTGSYFRLMSGKILETASVNQTALTATADTTTPAGSFVRLTVSGTATTTWTPGATSINDGATITVCNVDASGDIVTIDTASPDCILDTNGCATMIRDGTSSVWRVTSCNP